MVNAMCVCCYVVLKWRMMRIDGVDERQILCVCFNQGYYVPSFEGYAMIMNVY